MENALARIRTFTQEMKDMQRELFEPTVAKGSPQPPPILGDPTSLGTLTELKAAVDDLRRMLFFYINGLAAQMDVDPEKAIYAYQLRRATELLNVLSRPSYLPALSDEEEAMLSDSVTRLLGLQKNRSAG